MEDASNTGQIWVVCAMRGIRFSSINCLQWGRRTEMGRQIKACAIYGIQFSRINCLWWGRTTKTGSQMKVYAIYVIQFTLMNYVRWAKRTKMVQLNKMCVIRGKQVCNQKRVRRPIRTQTITANKLCVLWANDCWYTIVSDWWKHHRWFHCLVRVRCDFVCPHNIYTLSIEHQHIYLKRQHCITKLSIQLHKWLHT